MGKEEEPPPPRTLPFKYEQSDRNSALLKCPPVPAENSHEIISDGPISIWHYGDDENESENDHYAFQIVREVVPMFFVTYNHQTSVIAQSSIPIYIPSSIEVVVDGEHVKLYIGEGCKLIYKGEKRGQNTISKDQIEVPKSRIVVLHCADVQQLYGDVIQVFITARMVAYCGGKNRITLNVCDTQIVELLRC